MKTTCFFNLVLVLTSTAFFTPFVAGFNATSDAVEGSEAVSDVGVSAFQEMVDAGNCKNRGEKLNYVVGKSVSIPISNPPPHLQRIDRERFLQL
ncbi:hypothetical protein ONZ45_g6033 [Pleurotus djamor]|nr:hypothetical protein ONZ45_g6033 [Pleurotus djamor]